MKENKNSVDLILIAILVFCLQLDCWHVLQYMSNVIGI